MTPTWTSGTSWHQSTDVSSIDCPGSSRAVPMQQCLTALCSSCARSCSVLCVESWVGVGSSRVFLEGGLTAAVAAAFFH